MRDLRIDTLRGFFLLVVTVSHLPFHFQDPVQDLAVQGNYFEQIFLVGLLMAGLWIPPILKEWHGRRLKWFKALEPTMKAA